MVLIIRNNRIQSRRHSRINLLSKTVYKSKQNSKDNSETESEDKKSIIMSRVTSVVNTFFLYSLAMFTLPFIAFFTAQHIMNTKFHADIFVTNCVSVVSAVIVVNLIIGVYAYKALHEQDEESKGSSDTSDPVSDSTDKKTD
ncbi:unnamed protein product [Trichogramma brassicae]|uniref:Vacuolar ATPase assembly integral membrane protein VMA21 homolog n=1 Tax=Trichogramma brassicae TaxID=86971 RepID=A0A6H5J1D2_9HYME|nr:unnamed protein product [Trichogramma brassicae]